MGSWLLARRACGTPRADTRTAGRTVTARADPGSEDEHEARDDAEIRTMPIPLVMVGGLLGAGKAVLGWLNADIALASTRTAADWRVFCEAFMGSLRGEFLRRNASIGHVKILMSSGIDTLTVNLTRTGGNVSMRGDVSASPRAELVVNARRRRSRVDTAHRHHLERRTGAILGRAGSSDYGLGGPRTALLRTCSRARPAS